MRYTEPDIHCPSCGNPEMDYRTEDGAHECNQCHFVMLHDYDHDEANCDREPREPDDSYYGKVEDEMVNDPREP